MTAREAPSGRILLLVAAGFIVWSSGFIAVYGLNAIGCAFLWPQGLQRAILAFVALVHIAVIVALTLLARRRWDTAGRLATIATGTGAAAGAAAILGFLPPLLLSMCQ